MKQGFLDHIDAFSRILSKDQIFLLIMSLLAIMLVMDVLTTSLLLRYGGIELNPFMTNIVRNPLLHLLVKSALLVLVFLTAQKCETRMSGSGLTLSLTVVGWYSIVVGNNLGIIWSGIIR